MKSWPKILSKKFINIITKVLHYISTSKSMQYSKTYIFLSWYTEVIITYPNNTH